METKDFICESLSKEYILVKTLGKWGILGKLTDSTSFCISDKFFTYWGIVYDDGTIGIDYPERIPEYVKAWCRNTYVNKHTNKRNKK